MTSILQAARGLLAAGLSVIPIPPPGPGRDGKTPALAWRPYQERLPTPLEVEEWFTDVDDNPQNIAIITGAVSGIVVVDSDSPEAEAWCAKHLPPTPWMVRTSKGMHRYYRHPGGRIRNKARFGPDGMALDLRGDGGYVVGPGSVHLSGVVYSLEGDWDAPKETLPILPLELLGAPREPYTAPVRPPPANGSGAPVLERARAYLAAVPGAVQGEGGDAHTFRAACKLVRGFGLTEDQALQLLGEWNGRCTPPWGQRELELKVRNALRYGEEPVDARRNEPGPEAAAPVRMGGKVLGKGPGGGMDPDHPQAEHDVSPQVAKPAQAPARLWIEPALDFLAEPDAPDRWLVEQLLPEQVLCLVHGEPRARKSWFALELAVALATGTPAFGLSRFNVPGPVPVLYSSQEDARSRVKKRVRRFLNGRDVETPSSLYLSVHADINLEDALWQQTMIEDGRRLGLRAIILDPIRRYSPNADKGPAEVRAITSFLRKLSVDVGCTVIIVHHDVKPNAKEEDNRRRGHRASGGDWFAASEAPIHLEVAGRDRSLVVPEDYKFSDDPGPFVFSIEGKSTSPTVRLLAEDASADDAKRLAVEEKILAYLGEHPGQTMTAISRGVRVRKEAVSEVIERLSLTGRIDSVQGARKAIQWFLPATVS